uniref:Uncharacterized protein n=1 Tax=Ciona savignyi TaxID=51511 RepID=H2YHZ1_CIOSA
MERLGFIYHKSQQAFLFHPQSLTGPWREQLSHVGMDFFLVHVRCAVASAQSGRTVAVQDTITAAPTFSTRGIFPKPIPDNYVRALPMNHSAPLVGLNQPMKHRRAPTSAPDWSRIEAVPPIPWQHRRKPKMTQQISEEDELYAAADESLEKIHYPPPVDEVHPQLTMDEHIERAMRDLQTRNTSLPMEAMFDPNQMDAAMFDPNQRNAAMFDPNQMDAAMFDPNQRNAAMFAPNQRDAVTLFPRPPAEGKDSNENVYQEI